MRWYLFFFSLLVILTTVPAMSGYKCKWTVEGTNSNFENEPLYNSPPKIVEASACSSATTPTRGFSGQSPDGAKPTCTGFIYCEQDFKPPQVLVAGCQAIEVNKKWQCPTAMACAADESVTTAQMTRLPRAAGAAAEGGDGGEESDGGGGSGTNGTSEGTGGR